MESNDHDLTSGSRPGAEGGAALETAAKPARLMSLDAYRGLIMVTLAGGGFGIAKVAEKLDTGIWHKLAFHCRHPDWISQFDWVGCSYWDLIQPSFMFMVGVAMPFSYARRAREGHSYSRRFRHALTRALVLILLGVFLQSRGGTQTNFTFVNVLAQIGLGYLFVFLLLGRRFRLQVAAAAAILVGYWLLFVLYPLPGPEFHYAAAGIDLTAVPDLFRHWAKNANAAWAFDVWFLNLFPRSEPFDFNSGGYTTLNFVPSIVTMLLGVMAGELLRGPRKPSVKFGLLVLGGLVCMGLAVAAGCTVCPIVKRIWTPSWALFSGAWALWILAALYLVIDVARLRAWAVPLVIVGMNSILMYMMAQTLKPWTADMLQIHFGPLAHTVKTWANETYRIDLGQGLFDGTYGPMVQAVSVLVVFWLICLWLYRQKAFLRI